MSNHLTNSSHPIPVLQNILFPSFPYYFSFYLALLGQFLGLRYCNTLGDSIMAPSVLILEDPWIFTDVWPSTNNRKLPLSPR